MEHHNENDCRLVTNFKRLSDSFKEGVNKYFETLADNRDKFLENDRQKIESVKPRIKRLKLLYINTRIK